MGGWTLEDIPWDEFDRSRVDANVLAMIKAAAIVEYNAGDYRTYLNRVFHDDPRVLKAVGGWADEEVLHGRALGKWAELADPAFSFEKSFKMFTDGYCLPLDVDQSVRGSRTGELIARCMVETGTSSYYTALAEATDEPALKAICRKIADDEFAHYNLFHRHMVRYLATEKLGMWGRFKIAIGRIAESEDDELAYAYYAANNSGEPYDRKANASAYGQGAFRYYSPAIVRHGIGMVFNAIGLKGDGVISQVAGRLGWIALRLRMVVLGRTAGI
jgi:rubrerythrin